MAETRHCGTWTIEDRCQSAWHYLPVEVPAGSSALTVEFDYDQTGAVLDLGCFGPAGFRGWSGGARRSFTIGSKTATPGYLPGELEPGTWQVVIGLHRIPAEGTRYRLVATAEGNRTGPALHADRQSVPAEDGRPPRRDLPASDGLRWLAGDLHSHTVHSDGALTVAELARFAAGRGLDFLAVTDHNTISHHAELAAASAAHGIVLLPGQELTVETGHANALGDIGWLDFREPADAWLEQTERRGGLLSVNHPYGGEMSWTSPMRRRPPLLEVWHWSWLDLRWTTPLSWWLAWHPGAIPVGGSDWHRPGDDALPGTPTTWVHCEDAAPSSVLAALAAGRVAISATTDGPVLFRAGDVLMAVDADGTILVGPQGPRARVRGELATFSAIPGPHRLTDAAGATLALTA